MTDVAAIANAIEPVLGALGLELYDLGATGPAGARTVRIVVDREGGVDLDAIAAASQALSPVLDHDAAVQAAWPGSYTLEVTSPGLERRLRTPAHFRRAVGSTVSVKTTTAGSGLRRRGTLTGVDDDGIDVEFDTGRERLAYGDVAQARTVFEWESGSAGRRTREAARR